MAPNARAARGGIPPRRHFVVNPGRNDQSKGKVLKTDADVVQDRSLHHGAGQLRISREQLEKELKSAYVLHNDAAVPRF